MKKILIVIVILFCFQANISMCAEEPKKQGWGDWFWSNFNTPQAASARERLKQAAANVPIAAATYRALPLLQAGPTARQLGSMAPYVMTGYLAFLLGVLAQELLHYARGGDWAIAIKNVKDVLSKIVRNPLLYPTKSLQLNALIKKDDFLKYINISGPGAQDILNESCNQLVQEINDEDYSLEQFKEENKIGTYIAELKNQLNPLDSLEKQIADLKGMENKQDSIIKMRGYLSLYYRLENQLEIEKKHKQEKQRGFLAKVTPEEVGVYAREHSLAQEAAEKKKQKAEINVKKSREEREMNEREIERLGKEKRSYFVKPGEPRIGIEARWNQPSFEGEFRDE